MWNMFKYYSLVCIEGVITFFSLFARLIAVFHMETCYFNTEEKPQSVWTMDRTRNCSLILDTFMSVILTVKVSFVRMTTWNKCICPFDYWFWCRTGEWGTWLTYQYISLSFTEIVTAFSFERVSLKWLITFSFRVSRVSIWQCFKLWLH